MDASILDLTGHSLRGARGVEQPLTNMAQTGNRTENLRVIFIGLLPWLCDGFAGRDTLLARGAKE
jgi:hypothetical protein